MNHPLLGDPASVSALGATLRRTALELTAHADRVRATLDDASPGWTGPRAVATRQRVDRVAASAAASAATLDECARSLQQSAAELAATTAGLRALEEEAAAAGLQVRDGTVHRAWGITGVADAGGEAAGADRREELQGRVHQLVAGLGSDRARLAADCRRAAHELALAAAALRT